MSFRKILASVPLIALFAGAVPAHGQPTNPIAAEQVVRGLIVTHGRLLLRYSMPVWWSNQSGDYFSDALEQQFVSVTEPLSFDPLMLATGTVPDSLTNEALPGFDASTPGDTVVAARFTAGSRVETIRLVVGPDSADGALQVHDILGDGWSLSEELAARQPQVAARQ